MRKMEFYIFIVLTMSLACNDDLDNRQINEQTSEPVNDEKKLSNSNGQNIDSLKKQVVMNVDIKAYRKLSNWGLDSREDRIFFENFIMTTKYKHAPAYSNTFYSFLAGYEKYGMTFKDMDNETKS